MTDDQSEIQQKLIEFATKTAETVQTQAGQIQAISHVLLIALVSMNEQSSTFKRDFLERIIQVRDQMSDKPIDQFTKDYLEELVKFLENPYHYSTANNTEENKPGWFKGIITGGKEKNTETDSTPDNT